MSPLFRVPQFNGDDAERAHYEWGCNCGPAAIAAICGLTLDEVRPFMGEFESKGYTNPTLMCQTLTRIGVKWEGGLIGVKVRGLGGRPPWPYYGLARVQWEGPWTDPGVPARARYRYTHWVGTCRGDDDTGIFDVNAMNGATGWVSEADWAETIAPWIIKEVRRANGRWHLTHLIEVLSGPSPSGPLQPIETHADAPTQVVEGSPQK